MKFFRNLVGLFLLIPVLIAVILFALPLSGNAEAAKPPGGGSSRDYSKYAVDSYTAMRSNLYADNNLFREAYPYTGGNPYSYNWPFAEAMRGTTDLLYLPNIGNNYSGDVNDRKIGLERYFDAQPVFGLPAYDSYVRPPQGNGGDKYYDDNAVDGLNLVRVYRMTGDTTSLDKAKAIFDFIVTGWDTTMPCATGGLYWKQQTPTETNRVRGANINSITAELGLRLYQITGQQSYYDWSVQMYDWTNTNLKDPTDNLFWDQIQGDCSKIFTKYSYNQGSMIGANVLLYKINNDTSKLQEAETIASNAIDYYNRTGWFNQDASFNAILIRNMFFLSSVTNNTALKTKIRTSAETYANSVWDNPQIRKKSTNLHYFSCCYNVGGKAYLLHQGAMIQIYSLLAWDSSKYDFAL